LTLFTALQVGRKGRSARWEETLKKAEKESEGWSNKKKRTRVGGKVRVQERDRETNVFPQEDGQWNIGECLFCVSLHDYEGRDSAT